ncbi:DUF4190 domain-containing protein [Nocardia amamiensis]|uniref:DUF4190 domain-containing protein n=1 Tax=Nocardia amamiensis TaxID=404578 RepID=UPI000A0204B1|nr:DUF4190 domain-containing protein [Nocardia amamiensis]
MTNPGDSDEWWKQYGGQGVSPESGGQSSLPQYPNAEQPSGYPSAPQYPVQPPSQPMTPPPQPQYPSYQQPAQPYPQPNYGYQSPYQPYGAPVQGTNGVAIGALISSLVGFVTCGLGSIIGVILGVVALNQIKQSGQEGRGMALAGIWIGIGAFVLGLLYFVVVIVVGFSSA